MGKAVERYIFFLKSRILIIIERVRSMKQVVEVVNVETLKIIEELTCVKIATRTFSDQ